MTHDITPDRASKITALKDRLVARWSVLPGNVRGGLWILLSTFFFSVMILLIKLAGQRLHVTEILFFRQVVMMVIAAPVIASGFPGSLVTRRLDLQALRVGCAFFAMLLGFTAVINLPLANATTLSFAKTFFMTLLAIWFLSEVVGLRRWGAVIVGFVGILFVAWPDPATGFNIYSGFAIISSFFVACVMILIRKLSQVDQPVTILSYQAIGIGFLMLGPTIYFWKTPTFEETLMLVAIGVVSAIGQTCNIFGLRAGEASAVAPLDYSRLLFAVLFGWLVFLEWPEPRVFVGAALIVGASLYTLQRERRLGREVRAKAKIETGSLR
ncbi:MAG: DMT family transporter [Pseudomonadota bacterium]